MFMQFFWLILHLSILLSLACGRQPAHDEAQQQTSQDMLQANMQLRGNLLSYATQEAISPLLLRLEAKACGSAAGLADEWCAIAHQATVDRLYVRRSATASLALEENQALRPYLNDANQVLLDIDGTPTPFASFRELAYGSPAQLASNVSVDLVVGTEIYRLDMGKVAAEQTKIVITLSQ